MRSAGSFRGGFHEHAFLAYPGGDLTPSTRHNGSCPARGECWLSATGRRPASDRGRNELVGLGRLISLRGAQ